MASGVVVRVREACRFAASLSIRLRPSSFCHGVSSVEGPCRRRVGVIFPRSLPRFSLGFPGCWSESCQSAFLGLLPCLPSPRCPLPLFAWVAARPLPPPLWRPTRKEGGSPGRPSDNVAVRSFMQGGGEAQLCRFVSHLSSRHSPPSRAPAVPPPPLPAPLPV